MNYLNPPGFLGTGASLLADVTVLAYILLIIPGMVAGLYFARSGKHRPHHRNIMIAITLVNWVFILWVMVAALSFDVTPNISEQPSNARYLFPAIHGALGLTAQLLGTYVVYRMIREDTQVANAKKRGETQLSKYWFKSAKPAMRIVLALWFVTAAIGITTYLIRYEIVTIPGGSAPPPVATVEVEPPLATEDVEAPAETPDVEPTDEVEPPAETPEIEPTETEEIDEPVETPEIEIEDIEEPVETPDVEAPTEVAQVLSAPTVPPPAETPDVLAPVSTDDAIQPTATSTRRPTSTLVPRTTTQPTQPVGDPLVVLGGNDDLGAFLIDPEGRTLYVYANDEPGWSNCTGTCLNNWEVYEVDSDTPLVLGAGVEGELGLTERADGTYQVTYDDQPLYFFALDRNPGDAIGNGAGNLWSVVLIEL